ncbi:MAG: CBS domain-containing protein [Steroidobacteraceae bacterium]
MELRLLHVVHLRAFTRQEITVQRAYLLSARRAYERAASLRARTDLRPLKASDPAARAVTDFVEEPPLTMAEDCALDEALDQMFRLGVRAFLVVRQLTVVGLITAEDAQAMDGSSATRVAERMTPAHDMPAIDWQTVQESRVRDLLEIFEGAGVNHLVVLEGEAPDRARVRGLVHRSRLERRLQAHADMI